MFLLMMPLSSSMCVTQRTSNFTQGLRMQSKTKMADQGYIFVTVGTTSFDSLIEKASSKRFCELCQKLGYHHLLLQIGRGVFEPDQYQTKHFTLEYYRFKDSIAEDLENASLVISHAGSGSILESLRAGRRLIVVVNEQLMDNHQVELANQLEEDGYIFCATCSTIMETLQEKDCSTLKVFPPGKPELFASFLDRVMGLKS